MDNASSDDAGNLVGLATKTGEAVADQAKKVLGEAGVTAQQACSQAGEGVVDVVNPERRAHRPVSHQIHENPVMAILIGCVLGYVAGWWIHGGGRPGKIQEP